MLAEAVDLSNNYRLDPSPGDVPQIRRLRFWKRALLH